MQINPNYNYLNPYEAQQTNLTPNEQEFDKSVQNTDETANNPQNKENNGEQTQMVNGKELTMSEVREVRELEKIDAQVKAHEAAHQAAGGGLAGAASFSYQKGPDNKMYAVAGEVPIQIKEGSTPQETIAIARQIQAAAMAPADPSPQDYRVAASAVKLEMEAKIELSEQQEEERKEVSQDNQTNQTNSTAQTQEEANNFDKIKLDPLANILQDIN
nr:hypothetical protein [Campylobacter sp.]